MLNVIKIFLSAIMPCLAVFISNISSRFFLSTPPLFFPLHLNEYQTCYKHLTLALFVCFFRLLGVPGILSSQTYWFLVFQVFLGTSFFLISIHILPFHFLFTFLSRFLFSLFSAPFAFTLISNCIQKYISHQFAILSLV